MSTEPFDLDVTLVTIIANAGESKSYAMAAIEAARGGRFEEADELLAKADESRMRAHEAHTLLIVSEANNVEIRVNLLLVHASNHLSVAEMTRDMASTFIKLLKEIKEHA